MLVLGGLFRHISLLHLPDSTPAYKFHLSCNSSTAKTQPQFPYFPRTLDPGPKVTWLYQSASHYFCCPFPSYEVNKMIDMVCTRSTMTSVDIYSSSTFPNSKAMLLHAAGFPTFSVILTFFPLTPFLQVPFRY